MRPGYKQTEIGVIPEDWEAVPIGDLFTFKNGLNKAKQFFGYGTPIVNYMDVFGHPSLRVDDVAGRVDVTPRELSAYEVRKGDVFFTRTSETVEEIGVASVMLDEPERTVFSGFILRARPSDLSLDDAFKAHCFSPRYFRQQVTARASYTTRALTNGRSLSAAHLARPPLPEQRAIAAALLDGDAARVGLRRLIAKKRALKQAAMQQLLTGQTRLQGFGPEVFAYKQTDIGVIPEDWDCERVRNAAASSPNAIVGGPFGSDLVSADYVDAGVPVIRGQNMLGASVSGDFVFVSHEKARKLSANLARPGDIIFTQRGTLGQVALVPESSSDSFLVSQSQMKLTLNLRRHDPHFVVQYFGSRFGQKLIFDSAIQTGVPHTNLGILRAYQFPSPPLAEQRAIAEVFSDMDAELAALEAQVEKIRMLKQAMIQELLTGHARLPIPEDADG